MGRGAETAKGAAGGAMAGAAFGPWGAAIGGVVGGGIGYLSYDDSAEAKGGAYEDQLKRLSAGYGQRLVNGMAPAQQAQYSGFRGNQAGLISQLEAMARGQGPSAAQMQMRESMDRAAGAQASAAAGAGGRGVNAGAAFRNASNNTAGIQAQGARDTATLRAQEQLNAYGMLGNAIHQGRSSDEGVNTFNAGQQNQQAQAQLAAQLQLLGLNDESQLRALMMAMQANPAGPGMGTQILAGGAQAMPAILQYRQGQQQMAQQAAMSQQPTSFGQYARNPDGSTGPITSPHQV